MAVDFLVLFVITTRKLTYHIQTSLRIIIYQRESEKAADNT